MAEITFVFNQIPTLIQCKENDIFQDVIEKFANKNKINSSDLFFLYNGKQLEPNQKVNNLFQKELKSKDKIKVLAYSTCEDDNTEQNIKVSTEPICLICKDICLIEINDYKMAISGCKNRHTVKDISISNFKNNQKINESKIICELCKNQNKASSYENRFYRCISCKKNLCPLCNSSHNKEHDIIDYNLLNYTCLNHNEKFNSYCKECKINLCMECESEHKDKENIIYFRDILPNKELYKSNLNDLKSKIDKYKEKISEIKKTFDRIIITLENYYEIYTNLIKDYEKKKKSYQILHNINEITKTNKVIINDINNTIKDEGLIGVINNSIILMNKMGIIFNRNSIPSINQNNSFENKGSTDLKKLYDNFIKNGNYEKLIYTAMLSEQCKLYEDMNYFSKAFVLRKKDSLPDERNLFAISCKNYVSNYISAHRTILAYETKEKKKEKSTYLPYIIEYKKIVENNLYEKCKEIINFIENNIIKTDIIKKYDDEAQTFFYKMVGDFNRYIAEIDSLKSKVVNDTNKYYNEALKAANKLPIYNSIKIGLMLNKTVFYYEILNEKKKAIDLAKTTIEAFEKDTKAKKLNKDSNGDMVDAFAIYDLMKENYEIWKS